MYRKNLVMQVITYSSGVMISRQLTCCPMTTVEFCHSEVSPGYLERSQCSVTRVLQYAQCLHYMFRINLCSQHFQSLTKESFRWWIVGRSGLIFCLDLLNFYDICDLCMVSVYQKKELWFKVGVDCLTVVASWLSMAARLPRFVYSGLDQSLEGGQKTYNRFAV